MFIHRKIKNQYNIFAELPFSKYKKKPIPYEPVVCVKSFWLLDHFFFHFSSINKWGGVNFIGTKDKIQTKQREGGRQEQ